ncbi:MAG: hypothetical protein JW769_05050 [Parachlamydiales bacterium]|nr:hypothetical protein [Parachlamydiales bacterium]
MSVSATEHLSFTSKLCSEYLEPGIAYLRTGKGMSRIAKGALQLHSVSSVYPIEEFLPITWTILGKIAAPLKEGLKFFNVVNLAVSVAQLAKKSLEAHQVFYDKWTDDGKDFLRWFVEVTVYGAELGIELFTHVAFSAIGWFGLAVGLYSDGKELLKVFDIRVITHCFEILNNDEVFGKIVEVAKAVTGIAKSILFGVGMALGISFPALGVYWALFEFSVKSINWGIGMVSEFRKERTRIVEEKEQKERAALEHELNACYVQLQKQQQEQQQEQQKEAASGDQNSERTDLLCNVDRLKKQLETISSTSSPSVKA